MSIEKTIEYARGFEDGAADREKRIAQLQADLERAHARLAAAHRWASATKMAVNQMLGALDGP